MLESLVDKITPWFLNWGLLIVLVATFLESSILIASVLPGESVLLLAGFFSSPGRPIGTAGASLSLPAVIGGKLRGKPNGSGEHRDSPPAVKTRHRARQGQERASK